MSLRAMVEVFDNSGAELAARLVMLALADTTPNDDGSNAHPAVSTIARKARIHERTAQRALRDLEQACEIVKTGETSRGVAIYHRTAVTPLACRVPTATGGDKLPPEVVPVQGSEVRVANRHPITARQIATPPVAIHHPDPAERVELWLQRVGLHYAVDRATFREEIGKHGVDGDDVERYRQRALELARNHEGGTA